LTPTVIRPYPRCIPQSLCAPLNNSPCRRRRRRHMRCSRRACNQRPRHGCAPPASHPLPAIFFELILSNASHQASKLERPPRSSRDGQLLTWTHPAHVAEQVLPLLLLAPRCRFQFRAGRSWLRPCNFFLHCIIVTSGQPCSTWSATRSRRFGFKIWPAIGTFWRRLSRTFLGPSSR
jgi:hypothetical protein